MADIEADIADLHARFVYTRDPGRDRWTRLDAALGPLRGDCEDWAYTMLWRIAGRSWRRFWWLVLSRRAQLWWTKFHGTGEPHHPRLARYSTGLLAATLLIK
jgi:hypothetical protein